MAMNAEIKAQWLAALRSGEYKQGKHVLHNAADDTFCCLGVLCDLAVKAGVAERTSMAYASGAYGAEGVRGWEYVATHSRDFEVPPSDVRDWAGLEESNPQLPQPTPGDYVEVAALNDNGKSFEEIADLIEEYL